MAARKLIDFECVLPLDENGLSRKSFATLKHRIGYGDPELLPELPGYGFDNYETIFTRRDKSGPAEEREGPAFSMDDFVAELDRDGVELSVVGRLDNETLADILTKYPGRFLGLASVSPHDGMRGVREFERLVRERGLGGLRVSALFNAIEASDRRYYPLYAKCVELDVPVRIYTAMNYANDRPYDLGHPRHLDQVACDFPELRIVAGLAGWPWINEMVGLLRRHPNLYADTAAHHPRYFGVPGSGWEMFVQFGNTLLQDKIMVAFSKESFGLPIPKLVELYEALPLKESVLEKWFYGNARRFLRLA